MVADPAAVVESATVLPAADTLATMLLAEAANALSRDEMPSPNVDGPRYGPSLLIVSDTRSTEE